MKSTLHIFKIGGNVIDDTKSLESFLVAFAKIAGPKLLIHGGGKIATQLGEKLGFKATFHEGRRITNQNDLNVVTMVYAGLINKNIVAKLQAQQCNALGLSGADANCISAKKRPVTDIDFGLVGDITEINTKQISAFLNLGITPVFSAIGHDTDGNLLNTNADTIASELAVALSDKYNVTLNYGFEKTGVLLDVEDENSVIQNLNADYYAELVSKGAIHSGMLPKLDNCFYALKNGVKEIKIGLAETLINNTPPFTSIH